MTESTNELIDFVNDAIAREVARQKKIIDAACLEAIEAGVGVRIERDGYGLTTAYPDPAIPAGEVREIVIGLGGGGKEGP